MAKHRTASKGCRRRRRLGRRPAGEVTHLRGDPVGGVADAAGLMASAARVEVPERAPLGASPLRRMMASAGDWARADRAAMAGEAGPASWSPSASQGLPAAALADAAPARDGGEPAGPADPPGLPDILARVEAALEGLPDERAELALMLALDERRTRRIVREELGRQRPSG